MNKLKIIAMAVVYLMLFTTSCEKEEEIVLDYTFSWLPVTNYEGEAVGSLYSTGGSVELLLKLKSFDDNQVSKVVVNIAEYNVDSETASTFSKLAEYQSSSFTKNEELGQDELKIKYTVEEKYEEKSVILSADIHSSAGEVQTRTLAIFKVAPFQYMVSGTVPYFYMGNNSSSPANSAGYTCNVMLMHYYGGFSSNTGEIGGDEGPGYTPDWVMDYYGATEANTVSGIDNAYNTDAWWYGTPKRIEGTTTATFADIETELEAGRPVIVHGNFMNQDFAHQIVLVAMGDTKMAAMDPRGEWDGNVKGTYTENATAGNYVTYMKNDIKAAIGADGAISMHKVVDAK